MIPTPLINQLLAAPLSGQQIEERSFACIDQLAPEHDFLPDQWQVVRRLIHTTADFGLTELVRFSPDALTAGVAALRAGRPIFADSNMIRSGLSQARLQAVCPAYGPESICCHVADGDVAEEARQSGLPRSLFAMRKARNMADGGILLFGNAPVALLELNRMIIEEGIRPALVVAMPVGFVHVIESKEELMGLGVPFIALTGRRGGSPLAVATLHALCSVADRRETTMTTTTNQALALVFFGTTADAGLKVYDWIEAQMVARYPQMTVRRAFTSQMVIRRLKERGITVPNLPELLVDLKQQGITQLAVLPFLIVPGQEFGKISTALAAEPELQSVCAAPLLSDEADYEAVMAALEAEIPVGIPTVIGCHGNEQHDQYNREIRQFSALIEARYPQVMVATVEGDNPGTAPLTRAREMAQPCGAVHFIPLMLVAGDHVMNDIMGDDQDSWKSQVGAATTTCSDPAGMNEQILAQYCQHLDTALHTGFGGVR